MDKVIHPEYLIKYRFNTDCSFGAIVQTKDQFRIPISNKKDPRHKNDVFCELSQTKKHLFGSKRLIKGQKVSPFFKINLPQKRKKKHEE